MNAITLLKQDHKLVRDLFDKYERCSPEDSDQKQQIVSKIIRELSVHAAIEEQIFYPMVRQDVEGANDQVLESLEEHHVVKWVLSELDSMSPSDERYDAKVHVLMESVKRHIEEEEEDMFPKASSKLGRSRLEEVGKQLEGAKASAPTSPQPRAPDSPPMNLILNPAMGSIQKASSRAKAAGQKVVSALNRRATAKSSAAGNKKSASKASGRKSTSKTAPKRKTRTAATYKAR